MLRDFTLAARALSQSPLFTITAAFALALAIGANGAIFGLIDALWFRPPGVRDPATVVRVFATTPTQEDASWSWPEYADVKDGIGAFEDIAARGRRGAVLTGADQRQHLLLVNVVSDNFFAMLGVRPALGRVFSPANDPSGQDADAVVLGHAFWQLHFGADPTIVGRRLQLGRGTQALVTVAGVLPSSFRDLEAAADRDLWMLPQTWERIGGERREFESRDDRWFELVARRRAGTSVVAADAEVAALAANLASSYPASNAGRGARVVSDLDYRLARAGVVARAMLGLVLLLVLITCVNVANLLFARSAARAHELAVRVALGAGRWRLIRQLTAESILLGVLGAIGGLIIAAWLIRLLPTLMVPPPGLRSFVVFQTDARVMLFTGGVTILTTLLFGVLPALLSARADIMTVIRGSSGAAARVGRFKYILVSAQIAVALVLLCVAGVLARTYAETQRKDLGITRDRVLTIWTTWGATPAEGREAVRQLAALPGVTDVAVAIRAPLSLSGGGMAAAVSMPGVEPDARTGPPRIKFNAVSANYFDVLGTRIVRGRSFTQDEQLTGEATLVVSAAFAQLFFPDRDALGAVVTVGEAQHRIVGIAQDAVVSEVGEPPQPYMYLPFWRGDYGELTFLISATADLATLEAPSRAILRRISPALEPRRTISMGQYLEFATSMHRTTAALAAVLGGIGLILTAVGVYGLVAFRTTRRTREIGIRMALGAANSQVLALVFRDGLRPALLGIAAGIPLALAATRLAASLLVGVEPWSPVTFVAAIVILLAAVAAATMIPARRATRIQPSRALRT
jgi:putative ABC transport system permease protein